jgi:hypothetical protein
MTLTRATMRVVDTPLADGTYDAFIVWAEERVDGTIALDLTITTGPRKGDVVSVRATDAPRDALALVGTPCTLHVTSGQPRIDW